MDVGLAGKVVVVTGASGGIGGAMVEAFLAEGAHVVGQGLQGEVAAGAHPVKADLSTAAGAEALFAEALEVHDRVDVCVANAGRWPRPDLRLDETPAADLEAAFADNLMTAVWTARAFLGVLARTGPREDGHGASLVFTGSTAGRFGEAGHVAYATSKAALRGLVRTLKNEIVRLDPWARVNLVEPGWTATERVRATLQRPEVVTRALQTMPLRQLARPVDIARAAVFLASPLAARQISGEVLTVAGGMEGRRLWEPAEIYPRVVRERLEEE